jgi:hypothetical protein
VERDNAKQLKATISRQALIFNLVLFLCLLFGTLGILGSIIWKQLDRGGQEKVLIFELGQSMSAIAATPNKPQVEQAIKDLIAKLDDNTALLPDIMRDLAIALLISAFVTFSIERYASSRLREHITYDVLSAAYAKVVPEKIYTQVADNVFRSDVYRRNWEVHIDSSADQPFLNEGIALITSTYSYDLENLNEHTISYAIPAAIDLDVPLPPESNLPCFMSFTVDDGRTSQTDQKDTKELFAGPLPENHSKRAGNLTLMRDSQHLALTADVKLRARQKVTVRYKVERAIRVPGNYVLSATVPADGIKIIVKVAGFKLTVVPLHPDREALSNPQDDTWQFEAGILPFQSFRFTSTVPAAKVTA